MTTFVVTGLGFGDEGKGTAVDYLARQLEKPLVIRATSGPQAAHNVVLPDGTHHTFGQFGSGFFAGADTVYSGIVCDPLAFLNEGKALEKHDKKAFGRIVVSSNCIVTTPYHQAGNKLKEILRGAGKHGSCGFGINEAVSMAQNNSVGLSVGDLFESPDVIIQRLSAVRDLYEDLICRLVEFTGYEISPEADKIIDFICDKGAVENIYEAYKEFRETVQVRDSAAIAKIIRETKNKIFESAQGILLDPNDGFLFPHVTRLSPFDVTRFLDKNDYRHVLVTRTYMSRHGAGPLLSQNDSVEGYDPHNLLNKWQGSMRYGLLDIPSLKYAVDVVRQRGMLVRPKLFVTHADKIIDGDYVAEYNGRESITELMQQALSQIDFSDPGLGVKLRKLMEEKMVPGIKNSSNLVGTLKESLGVDVGWVSSGETYQEKIEL